MKPPGGWALVVPAGVAAGAYGAATDAGAGFYLAAIGAAAAVTFGVSVQSRAALMGAGTLGGLLCLVGGTLGLYGAAMRAPWRGDTGVYLLALGGGLAAAALVASGGTLRGGTEVVERVRPQAVIIGILSLVLFLLGSVFLLIRTLPPGLAERPGL